MKTRGFIMTMAAASVMALVAASCMKKKDAATAAYDETVDVAVPEQDSVTLRQSYPGYLTAHQSVDIVSRVDGYITAKHFQEGQHVEKGQLLYSIESTNYANQVEQAKAQLATAEATHDYNIRNYEALRKALESDAVSQIEVVQAKSAADESAAAIQQARAALSTAQTTLGYCSVRAPFAGYVGASNVDVGQFTAGAASPQTLTTLYNDDFLNVVFAVDNDQYLKMLDSGEAGLLDFNNIPIAFSDTLPHAYVGKLDYQAPDVDRSTGTIEMKVRVDNPYRELKSGMYATVQLPLGVLPKAVLVKNASIGTDQLGKYLYTLNDSDRVVYTPIEVGPTIRDTLRVVTKGIEPGTRYVTKALLKVRDGMQVNPRIVK